MFHNRNFRTAFGLKFFLRALKSVCIHLVYTLPTSISPFHSQICILSYHIHVCLIYKFIKMSYLLIIQQLPIEALLSKNVSFGGWNMTRWISQYLFPIKRLSVYTDVKGLSPQIYLLCNSVSLVVSFLTEFLIFATWWAFTQEVWVREQLPILLTKIVATHLKSN